MEHVTSKDGTPIAYECTGSGAALVLVGPRDETGPLAAELAGGFTVYTYDQRGYGESGDTSPYAVRREIEDLEALVGVAGGRAHLYGASAGGALVLEAAAAGLPADRLAVYEVPYGLADGPRQWRAYVEELETLLAAGRRGDVFACFMRIAGSPDEDIAAARRSPAWPALEAIAHTRLYGAYVLGDGRPPSTRLARITQPTLVLTGSVLSPHMARLRPDTFRRAADAIAASIPDAERRTIEGQTHMVDKSALVPVLEEFFAVPAADARSQPTAAPDHRVSRSRSSR